MKKLSVCITITLLAFAAILILITPVRSLEGTEYQIKAAMIVNFIQFVQWPDDPDQPVDSLTIGVVGADKFGEALDQLEDRIINGKRLTILRLSSLKDLDQCQVVFVPESESYRIYEILKSLNGYPVLTIGEADSFTQLGGIIRFYIEENHVRFEINRTTAMNSKLKISAKLMEIARVID